MKVHAVILAAGVSRRFKGNQNKILTSFKDKALIQHLLETYIKSNIFNTILLLVNTRDRIFLEEMFKNKTYPLEVTMIEGGETRHSSEEKALKYLQEEGVDSNDLISIHDAARAFLNIDLLSKLISTAKEYKSSVPAIKPKTIINKDSNSLPLDQEMYYFMQTPQTFLAEDLFLSYTKAKEEGWEGIDTVECISRYTDTKAKIIEGSELNMKITFPSDLDNIERIIKANDIKL